MRRILAAVGAVAVCAAVFAADEVKPVEGTLTIDKHTYKLAHGVVYETKSDEESRTSVIASDRKIPIAKIKEALKEGEGSDDGLFLTQPHIKVVFNAAGEVESCSGWADNSSFGESGDRMTGELKVEEGKAKGSAKLAEGDTGIFKRGFEVRFDVAVGLDVAPKPVAKAAGPVKASVTGTFKGNGKPAKLAFVSARPGEPFADKPSIVLVFTEKNHLKEKRPDIKAGFGDFGSALIISLHEDGSIFGCEVSHSAHQKRPFSSVGSIKTVEFDVSDGQISGKLSTDGEQEFFDEKWEVEDLAFVAPYAAPAEKRVADDNPPAGKSKAKTPAKKSDPKPEEPAAAAVNVHDLPYPKDAADFEYTELVGQIRFKSATGVKALAADLAKKLDSQGWKGAGADLITANSSIISRELGDATLTIFVKPSDKGSAVQIMSQGLDWTQKDK